MPVISPLPAHVDVILADDHPLFLEAVERVLCLEADFRVAARCRDGAEVLRAVEEHRADLLVLDIRMPRKDGVAVLRELRDARRDIPVVVLTAQVDDEEVITLLRLGIRGLVLKEVPPDQLVQCLRDVHAGGRWLEPSCLARVTDALLRRQAGTAEALKVLTRREIEVVQKVATGLRNKAIANELCVSEGTIKIHLHNIYEKLELTGRFALMHWARERELLNESHLSHRPDYIG
jgi:DNA-binding NarL/FixJ family response regulator